MITIIRAKLEKIIVLSALAIVIALSSGCISTTESVFTEEASPEKALDTRVALARQSIGEGNWEAGRGLLEILSSAIRCSKGGVSFYVPLFWDLI